MAAGGPALITTLPLGGVDKECASIDQRNPRCPLAEKIGFRTQALNNFEPVSLNRQSTKKRRSSNRPEVGDPSSRRDPVTLYYVSSL